MFVVWLKQSNLMMACKNNFKLRVLKQIIK